jgi:hypothetical protein
MPPSVTGIALQSERGVHQSIGIGVVNWWQVALFYSGVF